MIFSTSFTASAVGAAPFDTVAALTGMPSAPMCIDVTLTADPYDEPLLKL